MLKAGDSVGGDEIGERHRFGAADFDLAHVADVEETDARADGVMLVEYPGILDRHVPAAEVHHLGAHLAVRGVQCGTLERGHRLKQRSC